MTKPPISATNFSFGRFRSETGNSEAGDGQAVSRGAGECSDCHLCPGHLPNSGRLNAARLESHFWAYSTIRSTVMLPERLFPVSDDIPQSNSLIVPQPIRSAALAAVSDSYRQLWNESSVLRDQKKSSVSGICRPINPYKCPRTLK